MYGDLLEKIERMSKFIYTVFIRGIIPASTISFFIITFSNLYIFDLGTESYKDILLMWVVEHILLRIEPYVSDCDHINYVTKF